MKMIKIVFITLACLLVLSHQKHRSHKKNHSTQVDSSAEIKPSSPVNTNTQHIQDMMLGNTNNIIKDRHPLWRNFNHNNYERPFKHGIVGPQWQVPLAEDDKGFKHIASPMPRPEVVRRILPNEFPPVTYSPSSFDMPMRKDVVQIDLPQATIRTTEESSDPRFPKKRLVPTVSGTLYHGTGSVDENVVHGIPSFLQKKARKNKKHRRNPDLSQNASNMKNEALAHARDAEEKASSMLYSITDNPSVGSKMILGVDLMNRYEQPDLRLHENNMAIPKRLAELRNTPAGVRAAHTLRRLP